MGCVYTTGAYLCQYKFPDGKWRWVVTEFGDDTFVEGRHVSVEEESETRDGLMKEDE